MTTISTANRSEIKQVSVVFVDTVAWIALLNTSDALYGRAHQVMAALRRENARLVTTDFVFLEVADALSAPRLRTRTATFVTALRHLPILDVIPASEELLADGWALYRERSDKEWGLTDCTSFALMQEAGIMRAFTSDHHFAQAGFTLLLTP